MNKHFLKNKGYFTIVMAFLIATIAFTGLVISYEFANKALGSLNYYQSMQAFYVAKSGIERANYDIIANKLACTSLNGTSNYTNATFPNAPGVYTVTASTVKAGSSISSNIDSVVTTIPLVSATGFSSSGTAVIDNETINYTGISGNSLTGAVRGVAGSVAVAHYSSAPVNENLCLLTSIAGIPTLTSSLSQRTLQETLVGYTFSGGSSGSSIFGAALIVGGNVTLSGGPLISNPTVTTSSSNFAGSTILSGGTVTISGSGKTQVSNGSGGFVASSSKTGLAADVQQNVTQVNSANIWSNFFSDTKANIQASSNQTYNSSNINGANGITIWTGDLSLGNSVTVGTASSPVILIVNGNFTMSGNSVVWGIVYVVGSFSPSGGPVINGVLAIEGALSTNGGFTLNYNPSVLTLAGNNNPNSKIVYSAKASSFQEQFI